jgi:integrase
MKYRKHSTRNKAFVQVNKKVVYLPGTYNSAESLAAYRDMLRQHTDQSPGVRTVQDLCVAYLDFCLVHYQNDKSHGQYYVVRQYARKLVEKFGLMPVGQFGPKKLREFALSVAKEGLARSSVNRAIRLTKKMFRWGVAQEMVDPSVHHALSAVSPMRLGEVRDTEPIQPAKWRDVRVVIRSANSMLSTMIKMQWLIGCRPGELCKMQVSELKMDVSPWEWTPAKHKNKWRGKRLVYFLSPLAQRILAEWLDGAIEGYVFSPKRRGQRFGLVYSPGRYRDAVANACKKAKVKSFSPHQLRHSRATRLRSRYGIEAARISLGMSSLDTAAIYAEANKKVAKKIAERF